MKTVRVKALTLRQPWASLMEAGDAGKTIETRSQRTFHRGILVIHAGLYWDDENRALCDREPFRSVLRHLGYSGWQDLPTGAAVAVVRVTGCSPTEDLLRRGFVRAEREFGDYRPGRYGWETEFVRRLQPPLSLNGAQGLFGAEVPEWAVRGEVR